MKKYGFRLLVNAVPSEMGRDFGKKVETRKDKISRAGLGIAMGELRKLIKLGEIEKADRRLPYDTDDLTDDMMEKIIGSEEAGEPKESE